MTLFEYLAIAFSLVLSFAALRLVAGLPYAAQADRRYWVHLVFVFSHLFIIVGAFWNFWSFRDAAWTLPTFFLMLTSTGLIYFIACTLIPEQASTIDSWRTYYYAVRRRFFIGLAAFAIAGSVGDAVVLELPWLHPARVPALMCMATGLLGSSFSSTQLHAGLALFVLLLVAMAGSTVFLEPGILAP